MKREAIILISFVLIAAILTGCATATGRHEILPSAQYVSKTSAPTSIVKIYHQGERPQRPVIRIASVAAHGNAYATIEILEETLRKEAAKVGADCVIVIGREITKDETVATYGGGIMLADSIKRPHMYGIACRYAKIQLGINFNEEGVIEYVKPNSLAQKIGLKEGMKFLAINGKFLRGDNYLLERELLSKEPGEKIIIEYLDNSGEKVSKEIVLEPLSE